MVKNIKEKGQKKRSLIIEHAKNELLIHGVNSLSLRKISHDLGISHGNLHYYFKTKDDLLLDIFNEEITKLNKSISHSTNQNFSIEENAKSLIDAILNDTLDPGIQLWLLLIGESITNDNLINFVQDENNLYEAVLANQIKIINKRISDNDSIFLAKYMRCIIDGFCIELLYADVKSQAFMNFYKNLKANLIKLLINN